jgi:GST-like protein
MFQAAGLAPNLGQFGHFTVFAKEKVPYAIERFTSEVDRLFGVLETQLAKGQYLIGDEYTIADMATWPWIEGYTIHYKQQINAEKFPNLKRWYSEIAKRPAVQRGVKIPS